MLLVRHAQSTWNAQGRWQGQADPPLSELGRRQAVAAAASIGDVDLICSSPQQRALQTATLIANQLGVGPVQAVDGLHERSAGDWSGLTRDDIEERFPGWLADGRRPAGYEADVDLLARVDAALESMVAEFEGGTLLVVTHGGVLRALEERQGVAGGRIPNVSGRAARHGPGGLHLGEVVVLLPDDLRTGGSGVLQAGERDRL